MTVYDLLEAIAAADDELLLRSETKKKPYYWVKYAALAACFVLVVAAAFVFVRNGADLPVDPDSTTAPIVTEENFTTTQPEVTTIPSVTSETTSASDLVTTSQNPQPVVNPGQDEFDEVAPPPFAHSGGDENAWYYEPLQPKLGHIPFTLFELGDVDEDEFEEWCESVNVLYRKGEDVPTDINGFLNVYAMMKHFDISDEGVAKAFEYELSEDHPSFMNEQDLNILLSRDVAAILSHFASDYSIVIGDRIYSPQWVYENSLKAYKEAGITPEMLNEKLGLYLQFNLTEEAKNYLINKINRYESSLSPAVGGSDYSFSRKYIDEVYDIHIASLIVGRDACDKWVNDIFLKKSPAEQEAIPPLFQIIVDLEISEEDLINKNNEYSDHPDQYLSEYIIDALYADDIETMKQLLMSPLALYYNEEIYTFDELLSGLSIGVEISRDTLTEYFDHIESVCEQNGTLKYMQEDIDKARNAYGVDGGYNSSLQLNGLEYVLNATWEPDIDMPKGGPMNAATGGYYDSYEYFCNEYTSLWLDGEINFIRYTVLERVDDDEAYELTGSNRFLNGYSTLYRVQLTYDYLNETALDEIVYLGRYEADEYLQNCKPAYAIGEVIVSHLASVSKNGFNYYSPDDVLEFAVYEINGLEFAYHIGSEQIEVTSDKYQNLDLEMAESEKQVITSTVDNPVRYTQKSLLSELTEFFDEDWATRRMYFPLDENGSIIETDDAKRYAYVVSMFGGSYDEKQCKFVMDSYWIESLFEILPEDEVYRFRDEVYYNQTLLEQAATPPLYQAVMYFGITREELRAADKYLPEYVLDAIYCGDEAKMKQLLMNEYSLYHDGEVYALYDLVYRPSLRKLIPFEKRVEYIEKIRDYLESDTDLYERVYKKFIEEMLDEDLSPEVEIYPEDSNIIFTETRNDFQADGYIPKGGTYSMSSELEEALKQEHDAKTRFAVKLDVYGISDSYKDEYNEILSSADTLRSPDNLTKEQVQTRLSELSQELPRLKAELLAASDEEYSNALYAYNNAVFEQTFMNFSAKWHDRIIDIKRLELEAKRLKNLGIEVLGVDYDMKGTCEIVSFITKEQFDLLTLDENVGYKLSMATDELCHSIEEGITIEEIYLQGLDLAYLGESKHLGAIENSDALARYDAVVYEMLYNPRYNWQNCHYCGAYAENGYLWIGTGNDVNEDILLDWISNESIMKYSVTTSAHDSREDVKFNHACKGDFKTLINTFLDICAETDKSGERLVKHAYVNFGANQIMVTVSSSEIADEMRHKHGYTLPYFEVK